MKAHRHLRRNKQALKRQRGAALVELALAMVFFYFPLLMGVVEVSRLVQAYKTLVHQVGHTARYLSVQPPGQGHDQVNCLFKTGQPISNCDSSQDLLPGFSNASFVVTIDDATTSSIRLNWSAGTAAGSPKLNLVTVTANAYTHQFMFGQVFDLYTLVFPAISATYRQVN